MSGIVLRTRGVFLTSLRNFKIQSSNLHVLAVRQPRILAGCASVFSPEINQIISRFESSDASTKDLTLDFHQGAKPSTEVPVTDGLPDLTTLQTAISDIPEITEAAAALNKLGEPTLRSLDLGSYWTPVGWVQHWLEFTHCTFNLPWWASISICVVIARLILFPVVIKSQRASIKMSNVFPEMSEIQTRLQNARTYGNDAEALKVGLELATFMKKNDISASSTVGLPVIQAPVFISFFWALKSMAEAPVESFKNGGIWWFTDLTVPDPYFILPTITCVSLFLTIQAGADFQNTPSSHPIFRHTKKIFKVAPIIVFPCIMYFPSAVLCYWGTTNAVSLVQVLILRIPKVRQYFQIDEKIKHRPSPAAPRKEGVVKGIKASWKNMQIAKEIEERDRLDEMSFKRAGRAPPAKTFKENPLLKNEPLIQAKKN